MDFLTLVLDFHKFLPCEYKLMHFKDYETNEAGWLIAKDDKIIAHLLKAPNRSLIVEIIKENSTGEDVEEILKSFEKLKIIYPHLECNFSYMENGETYADNIRFKVLQFRPVPGKGAQGQ